MDIFKAPYCTARSALLGVILLVIVYGIGGCQRGPEGQITPTSAADPLQTPDQTLSVDQLRERWLSGIPCALPCWEGVTPGRTSAGEAAQILNANPLFSAVAIDNSGDTGFVTFKFSAPDDQVHLKTWGG